MAAHGSIPTKSRDEYRTLEHIGRGAFGDVFLSEHILTGERVCVKEMDLSFRSPVERAQCLTEVAILKQLPPHPHTVGFRDVFWAVPGSATAGNEQDLVLVLVVEYADAGDLEQFLRTSDGTQLDEQQARELFTQLARGLAFLHEQHVVHRDVKCSNVFLFQSGRMVLGDFGCAKLLAPAAESQSQGEQEDLAMASTLVGSPLYMSPEQLNGEPYDFATDVWSLGCVLYELLSGGQSAFSAPSYPAVVFRVTQGLYDPLDAASVSSEARALVAQMLNKVPQERPSLQQVLCASWLRRNDQSVSEKMPEGPDATLTIVVSIPDGQQNVPELPATKLHAAVLPPPPVVLAESTSSKEVIEAKSEVPSVVPIATIPPPALIQRLPRRIMRQNNPHHLKQKFFRQQHGPPPPGILLDLQPPPPPTLPPRNRQPKTCSIPSRHQPSRQDLPSHEISPPPLEVRGTQLPGSRRQPKNSQPSQQQR